MEDVLLHAALKTLFRCEEGEEEDEEEVGQDMLKTGQTSKAQHC